MDGSTTGTAAGHDSTGKLLPGHTEWHARKRRLAVLVEQFAAEYDARSPIAQKLLQIAAQHLDQASTTRNSTLRGRATRLAAKVLDRLERRPQPEKLNPFDEYVEQYQQQRQKAETP